MKIKVGPITAQYKGTATYLERNNEDKKVALIIDNKLKAIDEQKQKQQEQQSTF